MALPPMPAEPSRSDLCEAMSWLMESRSSSEDEDSEIVAYLHRHLPDPEWMNIVFWPSHHPETRALGIRESDRPGITAELAVELAFRYRPIAL